MENLVSRYRTHTCDALTEKDVGASVTLSGWIHRKRDHGGIVFVDLRDHHGITQVVLGSSFLQTIQELRVESVISVKGEVVPRSKETINPKLATGKIEVKAVSMDVLSKADVLPFQVADDDNAPELTRLKYRFLDLRREELHANIVLRSRVINEMRRIMVDLGFLEFQTPILTSSSPEGARDFIVPSRHHPGRFFALPQAPQQFKQLLMVSGFDRYFQIAPCFRDEDPRADRSPGEFYQCDLEMAFVEQEDVFQACEQLFHRTFSTFTKEAVTKPPFPRFKYKDAMERFGSDKPDLRIPFEIQDFSEIFKSSGFRVFAEALSAGGRVRGLKVKVPSVPARKYFDDTVAYFSDQNGMGLGYVSFENGACKGSIAKFFSEQEVAALLAEAGDGVTTFFFAAGSDSKILPALGKLRNKVAADLKLLKEEGYHFCWITDYPMYEKDEESGQIIFSHNPFSMPQGGLDALNNMDPLDIVAYQYDVVCNGNELSSGAIRNHLPEVMYRAFEIAGYGPEVVDEKFGGMIRAFKFGAPPHGGMAPGVDRIVMLLAKETAIRDVIAFPMSQTVEDLLMGAPSSVTEKQLKELHIKISLPPKL